MTNILKLSKLENQQIFPAAERYDLTDQLCRCLLGFEQVWEDRCIDVQTELQEDVWVCADPELLWVVWSNLFSNAFKFTQSGGTVGVVLKAQADSVTVIVRDTGCGIDPASARRIFDKFYQADSSRATQGNGLGLALVKRVLDIVQGQITLDSQPGVGSSFTVRLNL